MLKLIQINILLLPILLNEVNSVTIFEGLSIKKGIDISFIPFPIKPIAFIKEKWTPFGSFGIKHGIVRREVQNNIEPEVVVAPVPVVPPPYIVPKVPRPEHPPVAPVVEHHDEPDIPNEHIEQVPPVPVITPPVVPVVENEVIETVSAPAPVEEPVPIVVVEPVVPPVEAPVLITPVPPIPIQAAPLPLLVPSAVPNNLNTDISRVPAVNEYLNTVQKPIAPVPPVVQNEPPSLLSFFPKGGLRTGSKLAIQLGSAFLHLMTQVFNSPQSPFANNAAG